MRTAINIVFLILTVALNQALSQANFMVEEWKRAKEYTKEYMDVMPEEGYVFKPVAEVKTFAQQYLHLALGNYHLVSAAINKPDPYAHFNGPDGYPKPETKGAVMKFVLDSYDYAIEGLKTLDETRMKDQVKFGTRTPTREQLFFKVFEHQTHHRGQSAIYLRLKGVVPPSEKLF
jgi:uncharacterized damage-inducible protein DinB